MKQRFKKALIRLLNDLLTLVFPKKCCFCERAVYEEDVCDICMDELEFTGDSYCLSCGRRLEDETRDRCMDCERAHHYFRRGRALLVYNDLAKKSLFRFKYYFKKTNAKGYAALINKKLGRAIRSWDIDFITFVPIHRSRYAQRGYNQSEVLANQLGKQMGIEVRQVLFRHKKTMPMKGLLPEKRRDNISSAISYNGEAVEGGNVLIVDDIYTTGATIDACAKKLLAYGYSNVYFIVIASKAYSE